jgi:peptide subunit release factor 1 (eRF1)
LAAALACPLPAHAGQACAEKPLTPNEVVMSMDLAQRTVQALDASGAKVALVSRACATRTWAWPCATIRPAAGPSCTS